MINNHPYFQKTTKDQRSFLVSLALISVSINLMLGIISFQLRLYLLPFILIPITLTIIAPFYDVPALVRKGDLHYHSFLFLAEKEKNGVIKIHGGTLFDYYFVIDREMSSLQRTRFVIREYLKGLINLIENEDKNTIVRGTSYIINERTAQKLGFRKTDTNGFQKLILIFNFFNILLSLYLVKKKLIFPKFSHINTYETKISDIKKNKKLIIKLLKRTQLHYS